jgi:hypothetical protein
MEFLLTNIQLTLQRLDFFWIIYKTSVCTSQETHYLAATKPNRLMLFRETNAVYCGTIRTIPVWTLWGIKESILASSVVQLVAQSLYRLCYPGSLQHGLAKLSFCKCWSSFWKVNRSSSNWITTWISRIYTRHNSFYPTQPCWHGCYVGTAYDMNLQLLFNKCHWFTVFRVTRPSKTHLEVSYITKCFFLILI